MSRRSGQRGYIEQKGNAHYVRFWMDVPGQEKRAHKSVRLCPVSGPGRMTKPERERRAREVIAASGADSQEHFDKVQAVNLGITFRQQADWWLGHVQTRKRKPIKPATARSWESCLEKWLNPVLGTMPLAAVNNPTLKGLVSKMAEASLSAKSIRNYVQIVKMVVASSVNEEGEQNYPRNWNDEFIDLPEVGNQRTPIFIAEGLTQIVSAAGGQCRVLYALLGGSGLRIGEALGLEVRDIFDSTISVRQSVWNGVVQSPKTKNAVREVDIVSSLAALLQEHMGDRKSGFVFQSKAGRPVSQTNILHRSLHPILEALGHPKTGFNAFRRFRVTWLRKNHVPEDLLKFWIGHASTNVTDDYSKLREDVSFRKACAEKVGLGFKVPSSNLDVVPIAPKNLEETPVRNGA